MKQPPDNVSGAVPLFGNKYIQYGSTAFTSTESDCAIRTNLTAIDCGIVTVDDTGAIATATDASVDSMLAVERVISSSAFMIVRSTQHAASNSAQTFSYIVIGDADVAAS